MAEPQNSPVEPRRADSDAVTPAKPLTPYAGYFVTVAGDQQPLFVARHIEAELLNEGYDEVEVTVEEHAGDCASELCGNMHSTRKLDPLFLAAQVWRSELEARLSQGIAAYSDAEHQLWQAIYTVEGREFPLKGRSATDG